MAKQCYNSCLFTIKGTFLIWGWTFKVMVFYIFDRLDSEEIPFFGPGSNLAVEALKGVLEECLRRQSMKGWLNSWRLTKHGIFIRTWPTQNSSTSFICSITIEFFRISFIMIKQLICQQYKSYAGAFSYIFFAINLYFQILLLQDLWSLAQVLWIIFVLHWFLCPSGAVFFLIWMIKALCLPQWGHIFVVVIPVIIVFLCSIKLNKLFWMQSLILRHCKWMLLYNNEN